MKQLRNTFKDLRVWKVAEEIRRIEGLLHKESRWSADPTKIQINKSLEH